MIIDAFPFFNELDVLEIRLAELAPVVDRFLLVEAAETYSGKPKPLYFELNKERFAAYPVDHVVIDRFPGDLHGSWPREHYTRQLMRERLCGLGLAPNDIVLLSDLDEIPRADAVAKYARLLRREVPGTIYLFDQYFSYYYVNCRSSEPWYGTRMTRWRDIGDMQVLRESPGIAIPDGGWHFSYIGGVGSIQEKLGAFAHTEMDQPRFTNPLHIERCMAQGADLFGRGETFTCVALDESFPAILRENAERYAHLIHQPRDMEPAERLFLQAAEANSDISWHLPYLWRLASTVSHVTEMGTRTGQSTSAFVWAKPDRVVAYDIERHPEVDTIAEAARSCGVDFVFHQQDVLQAEIEETDLLFIDTWHVEQQLREELRLHAGRARRYIVLHDTQSFGDVGDAVGMGGIWPAISDFLREHPAWEILQHFPLNNGLTVLGRMCH